MNRGIKRPFLGIRTIILVLKIGYPLIVVLASLKILFWW